MAIASQKITEIKLTLVMRGALIEDARILPPLVKMPLQGVRINSYLQSCADDGER